MGMREQVNKTIRTLTDLYDARGEKHNPRSDIYQILSDKKNVVDEEPDMFEAMRLASQYSRCGRAFHVTLHNKLIAIYMKGEHHFDETSI